MFEYVSGEGSGRSQKILVISAPFRGLNRSVPQIAIAEDEFFVCDNFVYDEIQGSTHFRTRGRLALTTLAASNKVTWFLNDSNTIQAPAYTISNAEYKVYYYKSDATWVALPTLPATAPGYLSGCNIFGTFYFSNHNLTDVYSWDGIEGAPPTVTTLSNAPGARWLGGLDNRLIAAVTKEVTTNYWQRIRWSKDGDFTDWTSYGSGFVDLLDLQGPISAFGIVNGKMVICGEVNLKLGQPTGDGLNAFSFLDFSRSYGTSGIGCSFPRTFDVWNNMCVFVGRSDVYLFDTTMVQRLGTKIAPYLMADILSGGRALAGEVSGKLVSSDYGRPFLAYMLCARNGVYVYDFNTSSWSRLTFAAERISAIGAWQGEVEINETATRPYREYIYVGTDSGKIGYINPNYESIEDSWVLTTKKFDLGAPGVNKTIKRVSLTYRDCGQGTVTLLCTNELGETKSVTGQVGTTGPVSYKESVHNFDFTFTGNYIELQFSGIVSIGIDKILIYYDLTGPVLKGRTV